MRTYLCFPVLTLAVQPAEITVIMRTFIPFLFLTLFTVASSAAQTARVQFIQNSPGPTSVDVYRGSTLFFNNFTFRTASPYMDMPAGDTINIGIAPKTSTSVSDAVATFPVVFDSGKTYIIMIAGVIGATGPTAINLFIKDNAHEAGPANGVDVTVFHGAPDFPAVDVDALWVTNNLVSNLSFGRYTEYVTLLPDLYDLAVQSAGTNNTGVTLRADLSNMAGGAITVFASGYYLASPSLGVFVAFADGTVVKLLITPMARVQVIHNAPESPVDIYIDSLRLADNFAFRRATAFLDVPAERDLRFSIAGPGSTGPSSATVASFPLNLQTGKRYVMMAAGIAGATGPSALDLFVKTDARETGSASGLDMMVFHGAPDAPAVDVDAVFETDNVISGLSFGAFTGYLNLPAAKYDLALQPAGTSLTAASFRADLSTLSGKVATVFASGFLNQSPGLALLAAFPDGTVTEFGRTPNARFQLVHNSPAPVLDVYVGNTRLLDGFSFRTATPFADIPADRNLTVKFAADTSSSSSSAFTSFPVNFNTGETYVIVASGIVGAPGPKAFKLFQKSGARELSSVPGNVDAQFFHGSTDAPEVDIRLPGGAVLFDNIQYGEFSGYQAAPAADYKYYLTPFNNNNNILGAYIAEWSQHPGEAVTVFASGYYSGVSPAFALWAAFGSGVTVPLPPVAVPTSEPAAPEGISVWPNPATEMVSVKMYMKESEELTYRIVDAGGKTLQAGSFGQVNAGAFSETFSVSSLIPGIYCLQVSSGTGTLVQKLVIQR